MTTHGASKRPSGGRAALKTLITVGGLAATALGWFLYGRPVPAEGASVASTGTAQPPDWTELLAPLPTLVPPATGMTLQPATAAQPVLRSVSLPAPKPVTITVTRSSR